MQWQISKKTSTEPIALVEELEESKNSTLAIVASLSAVVIEVETNDIKYETEDSDGCTEPTM